METVSNGGFVDSGQLEKERRQKQRQAQEQPPASAAMQGACPAGDPLANRLLAESQWLRQELALARAALLQKDERILEWIAAAQAWKAVAVALREEGQAAADPQKHPLAHDPAQRNRIYREVRHTMHARLKAQLYPPTSWRPR
jgi:hypothetical protein